MIYYHVQKKKSILSIDYKPLEQGRWASYTFFVPGAHCKFERMEPTQLPSPPPPVSSLQNHLNRSVTGCQVLLLGSLILLCCQFANSIEINLLVAEHIKIRM